MANEGLVRDSLLKMVHNPGGDWHPGWGVDLHDIEAAKFATSELRQNPLYP